MACPEENQLVAWSEGQLSPDEAEGLEAHLAECPACREVVAELARHLVRPKESEAPGETAATSFAAAATVVTPGLQRGERIGRYEVLEPIGSGGMGIVYCARDLELRRRVALKVLRAERPGAAGAQRLKREARALALLSHPNVVSVYDVGAAGDQVYVAMELVEGSTLAAWLREAPRSWRELVRTFSEAGRGLAGAHAAGLVHRDFKPENVLIGRDGRARVVDFGLARAEEGGAELTRLTGPGVAVGTPAYMSPELVRGERGDARSDQFSFCVALYEALYGARPSEEGAQSLSKDPLGSPVPAGVRRVLLRGLKQSPGERFGSMDALLQELARAVKASERKRPWGAAVGLGLVGIAALIAWQVRPGVGAPDPAAGARQALERVEQASGPDSPATAAALRGWVDRLRGLGRSPEAIPLAERLVKMEERAHGASHLNTAKALGVLGDVLAESGQRERALEAYRRSIAVHEELRTSAAWCAIDHHHAGWLLLELGRADEARAHFTREAELWEGAYGAHHPALAGALAGVGVAQVAEGAFAAAREPLEKALAHPGLKGEERARAEAALARALEGLR